MVDNSYGERLKTAMDAKGHTCASMARALGMSYQAVRKVINGQTRAFTAEHNSAAVQLLGIDPDTLATGRAVRFPRSATPHPHAAEPAGTYTQTYWPFSTPAEHFQRWISADDLRKIDNFIEICVSSAQRSGTTAASA